MNTTNLPSEGADLLESNEYRTTRAEAAAAVEKAQAGATITNDDELAEAAEILGAVSGARKDGDRRRLELTKPLRENVDRVNAAFKEVLSPLDGAEKALKAEVARYGREQREKAEAERRRQERLAAERQRRENERAAREERPALEHTAPPVPEPPRSVKTTTGAGVSTRKVWKYEVTSAWEVPPQFLKVDEAKIAEAVKSGTREIPGVRIYEDEVVAVRR